jgi:broad specificity phosphatase PhoE
MFLFWRWRPSRPIVCRICRYARASAQYVAQRVLKNDIIGGDDILRRISAAQIEGAVVDQVRALLRQPEIMVGGWLAAREDAPDLPEEEARDALARLDPLWEELFPAEQERMIHALVDRVVVGLTGADIRLRVEGLGSLARDLGRGGRAA